MCEDCKEQEISLKKMSNYTIEELKHAHEIGNKTSYTNDEIAWFYNLYNRAFNQNKQPGCGKCFYTIRKHLSQRYQGLTK